VKKNLSVEEFLNSKVEVGILRVLIQRDMALPLSRIAKDIQSNFVTARKHIKVLEEAGLVILVPYTSSRIYYKANNSNQRISAFKSFIEAW